ncbi:MAG TPA: ribosome small subunit-dependent GTPase A, partial [Aquifex aeolicus]|nr:ribosome small subunit-dependent GTPase A [Aquifex aeolicus]
MAVGVVVERVAQLIRVFVPSEGRELRGVPKGRVLMKFRIYAGDRVEGEA